MTTRTNTHEEYAEEADAAQRGESWPQAAALWRQAAGCCPDATQAEKYHVLAKRCDEEVAVDIQLADIARRTLDVPTLDERRSDSPDFHEVSVWRLRVALRLAYRAGRATR